MSQELATVPIGDPVMTPKWIAADLGVSLTTLWRLQRDKLYPAFERRGRGGAGLRLSRHRKAKDAIAASRGQPAAA